MVVHFVAADGAEPGEERGLAAPGGERAHRLDECGLHKILGNVLVSHAAEREAEQAGEVGLEQLVECLFVAPHGACGQGLIVHSSLA